MIMDSHLVGMIPCVLDFFDLDATELFAAGVLTDNGDEGILASFLTKRVAESSEATHEEETFSLSESATLPSDEFRSHFRMSHPTFCNLLSSLKEHTSFGGAEGDGKSNYPSAETQLLLTLFYLGSLRSQEELACSFEMDEAALSVILKQTFNALYELMQLLISWPDKNKIPTIIDGFKKISRLPNVLGAIDVTHINLDTSEADRKFYLNAKGKPTVLLQAVCDHKMKFLHCCTGWPGSVDDMSVLHDSDLFQDMKENQDVFFPENSILLGDLAYPLYPWLLTPFEGPDTSLDDKHIQYNFYLNIARDTISKAFLYLRRRFPRLEKIDVRNLQEVVKIILVACALHNFCIDQGDAELFKDTMIEEEKINTISEPDVRLKNSEAVMLRETLAGTL